MQRQAGLILFCASLLICPKGSIALCGGERGVDPIRFVCVAKDADRPRNPLAKRQDPVTEGRARKPVH